MSILVNHFISLAGLETFLHSFKSMKYAKMLNLINSNYYIRLNVLVQKLECVYR